MKNDKREATLRAGEVEARKRLQRDIENALDRYAKAVAIPGKAFSKGWAEQGIPSNTACVDDARVDVRLIDSADMKFRMLRVDVL